MKTILILANVTSGLYEFRKDLIDKLLSMGYKVYISATFDYHYDSLEKMGCYMINTKVDRRGINPVTDMKLIMYYKKIIKNIVPDKVITYTIKPNIYGGMVCKYKKIDYFTNITGLGTTFQKENWLRKMVVNMYKTALIKVHKVFFENVENRDIFISNKIVKKEKTIVLNGAGVNLEKFKFAQYPSEEKIHFIFIGRVMKEKGVDELFAAAKRFHNEYDNVEVDILGRFEDDYEKIVNDLDKQGIINYIGFQKDVRPFIEKASCFVLPSYHEGMANTLLECGAMGRPLITSNIHGCLEAVDNGKSGYLCNIKDAEDLYKKMKMFIELPYADKVKMGQASHEFVAGKFDKRKVVEETVREIMR